MVLTEKILEGYTGREEGNAERGKGIFAAQFFERPIYEGIEEASRRINKNLAKGENGYLLFSSPTACGTYGLDDS